MRSPIEIKVTRDIAVPMRDGTVLYADVYRPDDDGRYPVLLQRTPYNKELGALALQQTDTFAAVKRGYVVVIQDVRGRYTSDGDFHPFHQEMEDGYDTVEWCGSQAWSDGQVGMFGTSYVGAVQWLAAVMAPPSLKAIAPAFTASDYYEGWTYQGGALEWGFMCNWVLPYLTTADLLRQDWRGNMPNFAERRLQLIAPVEDMESTVRTLPLSDFPIDRELSPYFHEWLAHPSRDEFWTSCSIQERYDRIGVPALNIGGWFDIFLDGTIRNFNGVKEHGTSADARGGNRLWLGPWTHTTPPSAISGSIDYGIVAGQGYVPLSFNMDLETLRFFDLHLKGIDDGIASEPPVQVWVMGEERWRGESEWPLARTQYVDYYLHSGGGANSASGDGSLSTAAPGDERPDRFLYDPYHPVPTKGGQLCCYPSKLPPGAFDQSDVEARMDVLVYATPPLEQPVEVTGPITMTLWAATTAVDTDFTGKLVDIHPNGHVRNLTDGIVRARYRNGTATPELLTPGEVVEYQIDLWSTSNLFKSGHRIGLEVSSSNFPRFDRNMNTGRAQATETEMVPAIQTIHHDAEHPSRVTLPIIPR